MWTTLNFVTQFVCLFFLSELHLILRVGRKLKTWAGDISKRTLEIEFEQDWSVCLGSTDKKFKNIYLIQKFFQEKLIVSYCWDVEYTINLQNLMKIVGAIFEKMKNLNVFLMWISINFESRSKTKKKGQEISERGVQISNFNKIVQLV